MKAKSILSAVLFLISNDVKAFMISDPSIIHQKIQKPQQSRVHGANTSTSCKMIQLTNTFTDVSTSLSSYGSIISSEENEAQFCRDIAHFCLDVATVCSPDTMVLRLLIFCGRICSILSDYLPDHELAMDELLFQSTMLIISTNMFFKKLSTTITSLNESTSFRDRRIYKSTFYPAGFTWIQYRTLLSLEVLTWVHHNPETVFVQDDESLLIIYKGAVEQFDQDAIVRRFGTTEEGKFRYDVIGDLSQGPELLDRKKRKSLKDNQRKDSMQNRVLRTGTSGAMMLQIDMKKLIAYANEDMEVSENAKNLYFNAKKKMLLVSYADPLSVEDNRTDISVQALQL
jgi:hypothetical protein